MMSRRLTAYQFRMCHLIKHEAYRRAFKFVPVMEAITENEELDEDSDMKKSEDSLAFVNTFTNEDTNDKEINDEDTSADETKIDIKTSGNTFVEKDCEKFDPKAEKLDVSSDEEMCHELQTGVKFEVHTVSTEKFGENETHSDISDNVFEADIYAEMDMKAENKDDASPTKKKFEMLEVEECENSISSKVHSVRNLDKGDSAKETLEEKSKPSSKDKMCQKEKDVKKSTKEQKETSSKRKKFKLLTNLFKRKKEMKAGNVETSCSEENIVDLGEEIVNVGNTISEENHPKMEVGKSNATRRVRDQEAENFLNSLKSPNIGQMIWEQDEFGRNVLRMREKKEEKPRKKKNFKKLKNIFKKK